MNKATNKLLSDYLEVKQEQDISKIDQRTD
jgi:hypothetical protein